VLRGSICAVSSPARWLSILLALAAGIAFALSVQGGQWWDIDGSTVGPFGARLCHDADCRSGGLASLGGDRWMRFGMATWAAGLIALLVLVVMAAAIAARRVPKLVARTVLVSVVTGAIAGVAFVATFPGERFPSAAIAHGAYLFAVAVVLAAAAAITVLRVRQ
jgi:hypothetical protein